MQASSGDAAMLTWNTRWPISECVRAAGSCCARQPCNSPDAAAGQCSPVVTAPSQTSCEWAHLSLRLALQTCSFDTLGLCRWDKFRILPTDPGIGYYRPHIRLFDPGWRGPQAKAGSQDMDTKVLVSPRTADG